jgi:hypothetical protein
VQPTPPSYPSQVRENNPKLDDSRGKKPKLDDSRGRTKIDDSIERGGGKQVEQNTQIGGSRKEQHGGAKQLEKGSIKKPDEGRGKLVNNFVEEK